jgi:hypothetical protein
MGDYANSSGRSLTVDVSYKKRADDATSPAMLREIFSGMTTEPSLLMKGAPDFF